MALPAALTAKRIQTATVVLCAVLVVLSLFITISLSLSSSGTGGRCLLYADQGDFGPSGACSYIYTVTALFQLLCCLLRAVLTAVVLAGLLKKEELLNDKYVLMGCTLVDVIACLLTLVSGGLISRGFSVMCSKVFYPHSDLCGVLEFYSLSTSSFVRNYYTRLNIAQGSVWLSWLLWILLIVLDVLHLWRAEVLTDLKAKFRPQDANTNAAIRRDKNTNQSQRSGVLLLFRSGGGDSDTDSAPRTPPPVRPVPPRPAPAAAAAGAASAKPLMKKY